MCGRYTLNPHSSSALQQLFGGDWSYIPLEPRYNVAPTQFMPVLVSPMDGLRAAYSMRWGLVPHWAKSIDNQYSMINAREDTLFEKPAYRQAAKKRRCIVPMSGYYEWVGDKGKKQPIYFYPVEGAWQEYPAELPWFGVAGLWEQWQDPHEPESEALNSFTIITRAASEQIYDFHHRMPAILHPDQYDQWLNPALEDQSLLSDILGLQPPVVGFHAVSKEVNKPQNDSSTCVEPIEWSH